MIEKILEAIRACKSLSQEERVEIYNATTMELKSLVSDIGNDPVLAIQLIRSEDIKANSYNPNFVAHSEMDLLDDSISADGVTMPVVIVFDMKHKKGDTVDGFHRQIILRDRKNRKYIPCSIIDTDINNRMASTIRHNRARGKHQIDLLAEIVKSLIKNGWEDKQIAEHLGMTEEELVRLKQVVGIAKMFANTEYSKAWGDDGK